MTHSSHPLVRFYLKVGLIPQILLGLIFGIILAAVSKDTALGMSLIGGLFINALKSVAPILVLILVIASISNHQHGKQANMRSLITLYLVGMMLAALLATIASFIW
nr:cation:dicarboxylase symporter family transporter [Gilliamella bombi]